MILKVYCILELLSSCQYVLYNIELLTSYSTKPSSPISSYLLQKYYFGNNNIATEVNTQTLSFYLLHIMSSQIENCMHMQYSPI